jgi:hypothetical protein
MPSSTSLILQFKGISEAEAERLLALTWRILERRAHLTAGSCEMHKRLG